ncbi:glycosyltransferase family 39 protein [Agromyces sp. NPDC056523]|uniref:glycosyltransferase family 39 protein n=1 Tax=Agromyces sp. NPDC056523 TaxID=3345850 RepID=UPI00366F49E8
MTTGSTSNPAERPDVASAHPGPRGAPTSPPAVGAGRGRLEPLARGPLIAAMLALAAVLAATSNAYGYHRDELYFRMLDPAWGYVDQPPLTPLIARTLASIVDEPWFLHVPAILSAVAAVLVAALIAREVGGARRAQALAAWTAAASAFPIIFGHVLVTSSLDLVVWPLVCLFAIRALLRSDGRWWIAVGVVAGLASYNKLLVAVLLAGLGVGLLAFGPWRELRSPWLWGGVAIAVVLALPNLACQVANDWPQSAMGAALAENDGGETRWLMWPMLLLLVGPLLVPVWVAGLVGLFRRRAWRDIRLLVGALVVALVFTFVGSSQFYYPLGVVQVLLALGCVPVAEWMRTRARRAVVWAAVAVNGAISAVIALPLVPVDVVGATSLPAINQVTRDTVGWPEYVQQVADVAADVPGDPPIVAANYGEAGALDRFGPALGVSADRVFSGHNELWFAARPTDGADAAIFVGYSPAFVGPLFESCEVRRLLDNDVDVDNEEQRLPITVCTGMRMPWSEAWPRFAHLD